MMTREDALTTVPEGWELHRFEVTRTEFTFVDPPLPLGDLFRIDIFNPITEQVLCAQFMVDDIEKQAAHPNWKDLALKRVRNQFQIAIDIGI